MKRIFKFAYIFLISTFIIGCNSEKVDKPLYSQLTKINNEVDIWNSINYEIITDKQLIREVEPAANDEKYLVNILIKIANNGKKRAESVNIKFNESLPYKFTHGSGHEGSSHGYLAKDEKYEVYRYYTFNSQEDVEDFIKESNITVEWKEKGEIREIYLKLPSKPTQ